MTLTHAEIDDLARNISAHAYHKHVEQRAEFDDATRGPPILIGSEEQLAQHIRRTLYDKETRAAELEPGREVYYNPQTRTIVILTPGAKNDGTCYRPDSNGKEFNDHLDEARLSNNGRKPHVYEGGIRALHPELEHSRAAPTSSPDPAAVRQWERERQGEYRQQRDAERANRQTLYRGRKRDHD